MDIEEYKKLRIRIDNIESMFSFMTEEHRLEAEKLIKDLYVKDVMKKIGADKTMVLSLKNKEKKDKK
ncbi:MAG: hypothetical protein IKF36_00865 [Bacilli bacterium]|nr:hypothetical protein [Bacilli bacterium]